MRDSVPQTRRSTVAAKGKAPTKSAIISNIAEGTKLTRKQVSAVLESLSSEIGRAVSKRNGVGVFTVPGLMKITRSREAGDQGA